MEAAMALPNFATLSLNDAPREERPKHASAHRTDGAAMSGGGLEVEVPEDVQELVVRYATAEYEPSNVLLSFDFDLSRDQRNGAPAVAELFFPIGDGHRAGSMLHAALQRAGVPERFVSPDPADDVDFRDASSPHHGGDPDESL